MEPTTDGGADKTITARTCTNELSVPDWGAGGSEITAEQLAERLRLVMSMSEIMGFTIV